MQAVILILGSVSILTPLPSNKENGRTRNAKSLDQAWDFIRVNRVFDSDWMILAIWLTLAFSMFDRAKQAGWPRIFGICTSLFLKRKVTIFFFFSFLFFSIFGFIYLLNLYACKVWLQPTSEFLNSLPWQGLKAATKKQKYDKICEKKLSTPIEVCLNFHLLFPSRFWSYS